MTLAFGNEVHTTGWHLHRALRAIGADVSVTGPGHPTVPHRREVPMIWVESSAQWIPPSVADGEQRSTVAWLIDTHRRGRWRREMPRLFGSVGFAQRNALDRARRRSLHPERLTWVPLAAPIDLARPDDELAGRRYDIAFVGQTPAGSRRAGVMEALGRQFTVAPRNGRVTPQQMMALYGSARIVVNIPLAGELNMRSFEATASRAVLLCAPTADLDHVLPGATYVEVGSTDPAAWVDAARKILTDPGSQAMADDAFAHITAGHTYHHRARELLELARPPIDATSNPRVTATMYAEWGQASSIRALSLGPIERSAAQLVAGVSRFEHELATRFPVVKRIGGGPRF